MSCRIDSIGIRFAFSAVCIALMLPPPALAATYCATNGAQLNAALAVAAVNGESDLIKVVAGFHAFPGAGGSFDYQPAAGSGEIFDLEISGGWSEFFGNPCGQQLDSENTFSTVLVGTGPTLLRMTVPFAGADTDLSVRRLTFLGGGDGSVNGGGLRILATAGGYAGTLRVDRCAFIDNAATGGAALFVSLKGGTLRVSNSLFDGNHATLNGTVNINADAASAVYVTNTTVVNNTSDGDLSGLIVSLAGATSRALIANNNLWANQGSDLHLSGSGTILRNNNFGSRTGFAPIESSGNISVLPVYENGSLNFTPAYGSALRDAGTRPPSIVPIPPPFEADWATGTHDVLMRPRVTGTQIDIGAYESDSDHIFSNGFEPASP